MCLSYQTEKLMSEKQPEDQSGEIRTLRNRLFWVAQPTVRSNRGNRTLNRANIISPDISVAHLSEQRSTSEQRVEAKTEQASTYAKTEGCKYIWSNTMNIMPEKKNIMFE